MFSKFGHIYYLIYYQEVLPLMPALTSGRYQVKCIQLANLPIPLFDPYMLLYNTIKSMSLARVQLNMLNIKCMSITLILTNGVSCHHQAITITGPILEFPIVLEVRKCAGHIGIKFPLYGLHLIYGILMHISFSAG